MSTRAKAFDARFGDNLRKRRDALDLSRTDLARLSGIPHYVLCAIEVGKDKRPRRRASIGEAIVLAEALGTTPGDLLRGDA